jgi:cytochrome c-type biogenesis protein CcmH
MKTLVLLVLLVTASPVMANEAQPLAADPVLEARLQKITEELRCLVCQNQTIADSHAELAVDLKNQTREMLQRGMTDQQITDYMVQRYGDFVLYRPPVKSTTWVLWFAPFLALVGGLVALFVKLRSRRDRPEQVLSAEEHEAAAKLLNDGR